MAPRQRSFVTRRPAAPLAVRQSSSATPPHTTRGRLVVPTIWNWQCPTLHGYVLHGVLPVSYLSTPTFTHFPTRCLDEPVLCREWTERLSSVIAHSSS